jgi:hypothetical protein
MIDVDHVRAVNQKRAKDGARQGKARIVHGTPQRRAIVAWIECDAANAESLHPLHPPRAYAVSRIHLAVRIVRKARQDLDCVTAACELTGKGESLEARFRIEPLCQYEYFSFFLDDCHCSSAGSGVR